MLNGILYPVLRNPVLVRLVKGALAVAGAALLAFAVKEVADPATGVPPVVAAVLTPILLAAEKALSSDVPGPPTPH